MKAAYATSTSVAQGGIIDFCVSSSTAEPATIQVYALVDDPDRWKHIDGPRLFAPKPPYPHIIPFDAGEKGCRWPVSYSLKVQPDWASTLYRAEFTSSAGGDSRIVEFIVRANHPSESRILYCWPVTTVEAYNSFAGDLYDDPRYYLRLRQVSFDRPKFLFDKRELQLMAWLKHEGFSVDSCSSVDLHADLTLLSNYNLLLSVGHDEYWSKEMRDYVEAFVEAGGNAAFFSANTCWWQVRFEDENLTMICYKSAVEDPLAGIDDSRVTINWASSPLNRPENWLTGVSYRYGAGAWGDDSDDKMRVAEYEVKDSADWVFSGTGLKNGDKFGKGVGGHLGIMGYETDSVNLVEGTVIPTNFKVLATVDLRTWRPNGHAGYATMGYYRNVGTVFTAGTVHWGFNLLTIPPDSIVETITRNVVTTLSDRIPGEKLTRTEVLHPENEWKEINTGTEAGPIFTSMTAMVEGHLFAATSDGRLLRRSPSGARGLGRT